jgi:ribosomal protein L37AE/L43A
MIAKNFRRFPDAMALQRPLPFGTLLTWHTARPGSRIARTIRAARGAAFKAAGRLRAVVKAKTPTWWKEAKARARSLADAIRQACRPILAEVRVATSSTGSSTLIGFNYESEIAGEEARANRLQDKRRHCVNCDKRTHQRELAKGTWRCLTCGCRSGNLDIDEDLDWPS